MPESKSAQAIRLAWAGAKAGKSVADTAKTMEEATGLVVQHEFPIDPRRAYLYTRPRKDEALFQCFVRKKDSKPGKRLVMSYVTGFER